MYQIIIRSSCTVMEFKVYVVSLGLKEPRALSTGRIILVLHDCRKSPMRNGTVFFGFSRRKDSLARYTNFRTFRTGDFHFHLIFPPKISKS